MEDDTQLPPPPPSRDNDDNDDDDLADLVPHAFHWNLPSHHRNQQTAKGIPYMTQFAHAKARVIVQLCHSIQLSTSLFEQQDAGEGENAMDVDKENENDDDDYDDVVDEDEGDEDDDVLMRGAGGGKNGKDGISDDATKDPNNNNNMGNESLTAVLKKCFRLSSQVVAWEGFKYGGIAPQELAEMILHMLRLVTACLVRDPETGALELVYEPTVGYIVLQDGINDTTTTSQNKDNAKEEGDHEQEDQSNNNNKPRPFEPAATAAELKQELKHPFALPSPAREALLSVLCQFLSNKGPLRCASNGALRLPEAAAQQQEGATQQHDNSTTTTTTTTSKNNMQLILHWQVLLRLLLRTAPYLDAYQVELIPRDSSSRVSSAQKRTVQFIRDARRFFLPGTEDAIWNMVRTDVLFHSHTHACYRGTILLYLLLPSRCESHFYQTVLPDWLNAWTNIDRCPEFDFLWLALFCRARKYLTNNNGANNADSSQNTEWTKAWCWIRRRLLTLCQYWCLLPIGGISPDKTWTQAPHPRSRACPAKLKALATAGSSYEEGIDFVAKIAKLLVASLGDDNANNDGKSENADSTKHVSQGTADILKFLSYVTPYFHPSNLGSWTFTLGAFLHYFCYELACRMGMAAGLRVLAKQYDSDDDNHIYQAQSRAQPALALESIELPPHEVVALVHALMPLCQQALYSKNSHVSRAAEAAMLYLVQMDPQSTAPSFCEFGMRALDVSAVHSAHQAPAALSALTRLIQPTLRRAPVSLLQRLPDILQLTLAGIDSNDQNKTIRTLILYRSLASWVPIGAKAAALKQRWVVDSASSTEPMSLQDKGVVHLGTNLLDEVETVRQSSEYQAALAALPDTSLLKHEDAQRNTLLLVDDALLDEVGAATSDWVLEFLERVFELLRSCGEREKAGKRSSGVASRHTSADVHAARNFSRVLKESLFQVFCAMDNNNNSSNDNNDNDNNQTFDLAARAVKRFVQEESLPAAAKDSSLLCQAVAAARGGGDLRNPGLDILVPVLTDDLAHHSTKTAVYRVRCLAGSVRLAGRAICHHRQAISETLDFCFASDDRTLFKTGCKLLRHSLATLTEPYPLPVDSRPRVFSMEDGTDGGPRLCLGKSAELANDPVQWHVPDGECVEFAWELLNKHVVRRLNELSAPIANTSSSEAPKPMDEKAGGVSPPRSRMLNGADVLEIRRCLRLIRYAIRGGASLLVDEELPNLNNSDDKSSDNEDKSISKDPKDLVPHEVACHCILQQASPETRQQMLLVRRNLCTFLVVLSSIIGSDTLHPGGLDDIGDEDSYKKTIPLISRDRKVCKETCDIALLLLTRRGASFRSQEAMTVWKAQKQISNDYTLSAEADVVLEALQAAGMFTPHVLFKDGEDGGKSLPRRVLVSRAQLFHNAMIRNASFEVPRRMRRMSRHYETEGQPRQILFQAKSNLAEMLANLESVIASSKPVRPLDAYEGILDGLHTLCCHSNTQIRASAIGVVDYALTRFGWLLKSRINRLLSAISLEDTDQNGKFGIPSCASLTEQLNNQGKRKRLSEAMKGVCSILSLQRTTKFVLGSHKLRRLFMKTLCETDKLISLMPTEEMQKMIHYMHNIFSPFRSKNFNLPRATKHDKDNHEALLQKSIDFLSERKRTNGEESEDGSNGEGGAVVHWRKMLQACWFLLVSLDQEDVSRGGEKILASWETCVRLIETEKGQPLQRAALGVLGKLSFLSDKQTVEKALGPKLDVESFCRAFAMALVFDHKEDSNYGGGHDAQWSAGVEDIVREASRFISPRNVFPFQRTNLGSGSFKVVHCQLLTHILSCLEKDKAQTLTEMLLRICTEMLSAPPNEDQKNQQVTSAEIFGGICRYYVASGLINESLWKETLLPHFDDAMGKLPFSITSAYSDALRFSLQFCNPSLFHPLIEFMVEKIRKSLWQTTKGGNSEDSLVNGSSHGTDGFNAQSKWLYLISSVLVELDVSESDGVEARTYWYLSTLTKEELVVEDLTATSYDVSWSVVTERLLPRLLQALGHPFHSCRDHISRLLFRICNCYRKRNRTVASRAPSRANSAADLDDMAATMVFEDPGTAIVKKLKSLNSDPDMSFLDKYNALSTARRFLSYCLHLGEAKFELTEYVLPVLPTVFESLKSTVEESISAAENISSEEQAAWRALEAEVTKAFRYSVSEISQTSTSPDCMGDLNRVLDLVQGAARHDTWQVRQASAHFLRCFQGAHKFLFAPEHTTRTMTMVAEMLSDERREVSSAAMAALTGVLTGLSKEEVSQMVNKYVLVAKRSKMKRKKGSANGESPTAEEEDKEAKRARNQQTSVYFLCAAVMAQPYETPPYVPVALTAISKHSFERSAPLSIRDTVKRCCAEYKRTHMSDNWEEHRRVFSEEQMEALEDVVSTPHYYA